MMKIYTKTGDDGTTGIQGGKRISKSDLRITAYGAVDEVNASLGVSLTHKMEEDMSKVLGMIQNELFVVGSDLSNPDMEDTSNRVTNSMICGLEESIDKFEGKLPTLANFILPGGSKLAACLHSSRTIIRRAEIQTVLLGDAEMINPLCIVYLNRLSDLVFVLGRLANKRSNHDDIIWKA